MQEKNENETVEIKSEKEEITETEKKQGMWCHLAPLSSFFIPIPFTSVIAALFTWQIWKENSDFVDQDGKESLNFQISMALYFAVFLIVETIIFTTTFLIKSEEFKIVLFEIVLASLGTILGIAMVSLMVFVVLFQIKASKMARQGIHFKYPLTIRFMK